MILNLKKVFLNLLVESLVMTMKCNKTPRLVPYTPKCNKNFSTLRLTNSTLMPNLISLVRKETKVRHPTELEVSPK